MYRMVLSQGNSEGIEIANKKLGEETISIVEDFGIDPRDQEPKSILISLKGPGASYDEWNGVRIAVEGETRCTIRARAIFSLVSCNRRRVFTLMCVP